MRRASARGRAFVRERTPTRGYATSAIEGVSAPPSARVTEGWQGALLRSKEERDGTQSRHSDPDPARRRGPAGRGGAFPPRARGGGGETPVHFEPVRQLRDLP